MARFPLILFSLILCLSACRGPEHKPSAGPLPQRCYVWQRDWRAPMAESLQEGAQIQSGFVVLVTEVEWKDHAPHAIHPRVDFALLRAAQRPISIALRVALTSGPFSETDQTAQFLTQTAQALLAEAKAAHVEPAEFQFDFDCAQKKLPEYAKWVRVLKRAVAPTPLVITTLPAWLGESSFPALVREADHYVLQVHSVASPLGDAHTQICDPALARQWVRSAERLRLPFEIALPTYRSQVGYNPQGKLLGIISDGTRPPWPPGTLVREYATDPNAMADLVAEWNADRPEHCRGLLWYRLPVGSDQNNWRWPTFRAVSEGRHPKNMWTLLINDQPYQGAVIQPLMDLTLQNDGETDTKPHCRIDLHWKDLSTRPAAEALPGWSVTTGPGVAHFAPEGDHLRRLPPGEKRAIGWLRLDPAQAVEATVSTP